jgi:hypothetical protein
MVLVISRGTAPGAMSMDHIELDQADEEFANYDTSDDALETAAATPMKAGPYSFSFCTSPYICPWS